MESGRAQRAAAVRLPRLTAVLGPAGAGKTWWALERYAESPESACIVVPTAEYATRLIRACAPPARPPVRPPKKARIVDRLGGHVLTFGEAARALAGSDDSQLIRRTMQRVVIGDLVRAAVGPSSYFATVREAPGFAGALGERIRELKLAGVTPEDLEAAAAAETAPGAGSQAAVDEDFPRKAAELSRLFARYEQFLRDHNLYDEEHVPARAAERVRAGTPAVGGLRLVVLDGFIRIPASWRVLLGSLAASGVQVAVTLPDDPTRPLLFATPRRTLSILHSEFAIEEVRLEPHHAGRPPALALLERGLFAETDGPSDRAAREAQRPAGGRNLNTADTEDRAAGRIPVAAATAPSSGLHAPAPKTEQPTPISIFDAPNTYAEAEMVARALRFEHDRNGVPWERCALIVRPIETYSPTLTSVFWKYGIPLGPLKSMAVADHPCVRTVLTLLQVFLGGWRREDLVAFMKSSYVDLGGDRLSADWLRRQARREGVREGRESWRRFAERLRADNHALAALVEKMLSYDRTFAAGARTAHQNLEAIRSLVSEFGIARLATADRGTQGAAALAQFEGVVADLDAVSSFSNTAPVAFAEYHRRLLAALRAAALSLPERPDAIRVVDPADAGEVDADIVAVMGLVDRVFPRRVTDDPFLRDEERVALAGAGLRLDRTQNRADDEKLSFYIAVTRPALRLILSYPRTSTEADALPSFYVDEVRGAVARAAVERGEPGDVLHDAIGTKRRELADVAPLPGECANDHDRLLAACSEFVAKADPVGQARDDDQRSASIATTRHLPRLPRLEAPHLSAQHAAQRPYRVTELESYLRCPFQHFVRYGLRLREETEGAGAADRGTLLHAVLRAVMRRRAAEPDAVTPGELAGELSEELREQLRSLATDARRFRRRMMEQAIEDALAGFAEREVRCTDAFHLTPRYFELAFGQECDAGALEPDDEELRPDAARHYDPGSSPRPLVVASEDGGPEIHLCGTMDRVDLCADGRRAAVIDYKLGDSVEWDSIRQGRSLQMPLYLLATEQVFGLIGAVGCYDSAREAGRRRFFRTSEVGVRAFQAMPQMEDGRLAKPLSADDFAEAMRIAQSQVRAAVGGIRAGRVTPTPGEHCRYCGYNDICRTSLAGGHDGEPLDADGPA